VEGWAQRKTQTKMKAGQTREQLATHSEQLARSSLAHPEAERKTKKKTSRREAWWKKAWSREGKKKTHVGGSCWDWASAHAWTFWQQREHSTHSKDKKNVLRKVTVKKKKKKKKKKGGALLSLPPPRLSLVLGASRPTARTPQDVQSPRSSFCPPPHILAAQRHESSGGTPS
jgi:hypothetical protein